jgi:hypothetical protein
LLRAWLLHIECHVPLDFEAATPHCTPHTTHHTTHPTPHSPLHTPSSPLEESTVFLSLALVLAPDGASPSRADSQLWGRRSHVNYKGRGSRDRAETRCPVRPLRERATLAAVSVGAKPIPAWAAAQVHSRQRTADSIMALHRLGQINFWRAPPSSRRLSCPSFK